VINTYKELISEFNLFEKQQEEQKKQGLNDFNILTIVRKYHEEVSLHSAMIGAFLDPNAKHYKGSLFLEKFLDTINLNDWGLDLNQVKVYREYQNIDLYITDGEKHLIIENKIWAEDQPCQIIKYINIIIDENKYIVPANDEKINLELLQVVYLTAQNKKIPNQHYIEDNYISFDEKYKNVNCFKNLKNYKVKYQHISYSKEILNWLYSSQEEVKNIINLNEAFSKYIDVVKMVTNEYQGKVMSLKEYILKENELEFDTLKKVSDEYSKMINEIRDSYLKSLAGVIQEKYSDSFLDKYMKVPIDNQFYLQTGIVTKYKVDYSFITVYKKDWQTINIEEKEKIFKKLKNIDLNGSEMICPSWNGYAIIYIEKVESKEFLIIEKNLEFLLKTIEDIVNILKE